MTKKQKQAVINCIKADATIQGQLIEHFDEDEPVRYCVVGGLLHCAGVSDKAITTLNDNSPGAIGRLPKDMLRLLQVKFGLTTEKLIDIQEINDQNYYTPTRRVIKLIAYINNC